VILIYFWGSFQCIQHILVRFIFVILRFYVDSDRLFYSNTTFTSKSLYLQTSSSLKVGVTLKFFQIFIESQLKESEVQTKVNIC
jgi:hypothetical protein